MGDEETTLKKYNDRASKNGRYLYVCSLGSGSFGKVLKAKDTESDELVAVKILKYKGIVIKDSDQQRKEVEILTLLKHENIVRIKDNFEYKKWLRVRGIAIVMELCPKGSLSEVLKGPMRERRSVSEEERFEWYMQLMSALAHIHSMHVAHRDIKPENILVDASGRLKIGDVGISKILYTEETLSECSSSLYMQTLAGTYPFMAPEVFDNHYTMKSDIFSMGLVMFVIFELPRQLIPKVKEDLNDGQFGEILKEKQNFPGLGLFYHCSGVRMATDALVTTKTLNKEEKDVFNKMLYSKYQIRPDASQVLAELKEVVSRREEEKQREELRQKTKGQEDKGDGGWCRIL